MLKRLSVWAALGAAVVAPAMSFGQAVANRVPADALIYVGWAGTDKLQAAGGGYEGSHLKKLMDGSAMPEFLDKKLPALLEKLAQQERGAEVALQVEKALAVMCKYPTALYIGPVEMPKERMRNPVPHLALICEAGSGADAIEAQLKQLVRPSGGMLELQRLNGAVVLVMGGMTPEREAVFGGKNDPAALKGMKEFGGAMAQVQKDAAVTAFVNVPALVKVGDDVMATMAARDRWPRMRDALNLKGLTQAAFSAGFDGKDWMSQGFVGKTGNAGGVAMLVGGKALSKDALQVVPADATWVAAGTMDLATIFTEVQRVIGTVDPRASEEFENGLEKLNEAAGVDIEKDVIGSLGNEWVGYSSPSVAGNGLMGLVVVNTLKDAPGLTKAIGVLEGKATQALADQQRGRPGMVGPQIGIRHVSMGGLDVHYVGLFVVNPAWCVRGGKLYLATMPQSIPAAVEQSESAAKSILDNEKFAAVMKRLGGAIGQVSSVQYVDLPRTAPDSYQFLGQLIGMVGLFGGDDVPPTLLPGLNKLLPELAPSGGISWTDASGWHVKNVSPIPGSALLSGQQMGMMGGGSPALMAAVLLPSLGKARVVAERTSDAANIRNITMGCVVYANDNSDNMPEHLAELVARHQITPRNLVVPGSGTVPLVLTPAQATKMNTDWHVIEKDIEAHCDYVYLGKGTKNTTDSSAVLVFTKPDLKSSRDGINMGFFDAHVEWNHFPMQPNIFTATNMARKQLDLPLVEIKNGRPVLAKEAAK